MGTKINEYYVSLVFIHELLHVMGVSDTFFSRKGLSKTITVGNQQMKAIVSPKVVAYAKEYFNCDSIEGVPLENGGGGGSRNSHWEKTLFPSEIMNPQVAYPATISMFTINLLEDMGWYKGVDAAQRYVYLKGDGCASITRNECRAENSEEFCSSSMYNQEHCYPNRLGKGYCGGSSQFMAQCRYVAPKYNGMCTQENDDNHKTFSFENYGAHSRCLMAKDNSNKYRASCVNTRCSKDKVEFQFGKEVFECPSAGEYEVNLSVYQGKIQCPSFKEMCNEVMDHRCPMDCYSQGFCMADGTCQCLGGFSGDDCNKGLPKETDPFVTGFDIRNKKDDSPKKDDDDDKKDDEDDKNDEEDREKEDEDDRENEDEREDEDEDSDEDDKEDNDTKSPRAIELEERIAKYQPLLDNRTKKVRLYEIEVKLANECMKLKPYNKKSCERKLKFYTRHLERVLKNKEKLQKLIDAMETELEQEMSEKLNKKRQEEQNELLSERTIKILDYLIGRLERIKNYKLRLIGIYQKWVSYFESRKKRMPTRFAKWYDSIIARYTKMIEYIQSEMDLVDKEIEKAENEKSQFTHGNSDLQKSISEEIQDEIEEQINSNIANSLGSLVRP